MEELISVIVPIYKVEEYLPDCLDSIINQSYSNLEIILVNDGSPDNCPIICEKYAKIDPRIHVIHQENGGISAARNSGLNVAKGRYIGFVDPDDYIDKEMFKYLMEIIKEYEADISVCNYKIAYDHEKIEKLNINKTRNMISVFTGKEAIGNLYNEDLHVITVVAWNKLYKKELFENNHYLVGKICEDEDIIHRILDKSDKVVYSSLPLYFYCKRDSGITGQRLNKNCFDGIEALERRLSFFKERGYESFYQKQYNNYLDLLIDYYYEVRSLSTKERHFAMDLRRRFLEKYTNRNTVGLPTSAKIKYDLFAINPFLCKTAIKLWNACNIIVKKKSVQ